MASLLALEALEKGCRVAVESRALGLSIHTGLHSCAAIIAGGQEKGWERRDDCGNCIPLVRGHAPQQGGRAEEGEGAATAKRGELHRSIGRC